MINGFAGNGASHSWWIGRGSLTIRNLRIECLLKGFYIIEELKEIAITFKFGTIAITEIISLYAIFYYSDN